ncbi:MAG TPA: glycosyltransferase family 87 protein, partial [Candidatus Saccharimonadales bacterium]|nr:glycosyltransferase family 87 protein [Candidatus Saccharimonadales bacterium]
VTAAVLFHRAPLAVAISAPGLGYLWGSGNVHGFVFVAAAAAWFWRDRWWIGIPLGALAAAKLFPIVLLAFLIANGNRRGAVAFLVTLAVCLFIGLLGAGLDAYLAYPGILLTSAPQPEMLASITGIRWLTPIIIVGGMGATLLFRNHRRAFQVAIGTLVFGFGFPLAQSSLISLIALPRNSDLAPADETAHPSETQDGNRATALYPERPRLKEAR